MQRGCNFRAVGLVGILFYPPKSVMEHYKTDQPITRVIINLSLCRKHVEKVDPRVMLGKNYDDICAMVEKQSNTTVDKDATKVQSVAFDHPDAVRLRAKGKGAKH